MALLKLKPAFSLTAVLVLPYGGKFQAGTNLRLKHCSKTSRSAMPAEREIVNSCACVKQIVYLGG